MLPHINARGVGDNNPAETTVVPVPERFAYLEVGLAVLIKSSMGGNPAVSFKQQGKGAQPMHPSLSDIGCLWP